MLKRKKIKHLLQFIGYNKTLNLFKYENLKVIYLD